MMANNYGPEKEAMVGRRRTRGRWMESKPNQQEPKARCRHGHVRNMKSDEDEWLPLMFDKEIITTMRIEENDRKIRIFFVNLVFFYHQI